MIWFAEEVALWPMSDIADRAGVLVGVPGINSGLDYPKFLMDWP